MLASEVSRRPHAGGTRGACLEASGWFTQRPPERMPYACGPRQERRATSEGRAGPHPPERVRRLAAPVRRCANRASGWSGFRLVGLPVELSAPCRDRVTRPARGREPGTSERPTARRYPDGTKAGVPQRFTVAEGLMGQASAGWQFSAQARHFPCRCRTIVCRCVEKAVPGRQQSSP